MMITKPTNAAIANAAMNLWAVVSCSSCDSAASAIGQTSIRDIAVSVCGLFGSIPGGADPLRRRRRRAARVPAYVVVISKAREVRNAEAAP
jgi:hypothetical protein